MRVTTRRFAIATVLALSAALVAPTHTVRVAASEPPVADQVWVTGELQVLAGEHGQPDRYSLKLPSGRVVPLAGEVTAGPGDLIRGKASVPDTSGGQLLAGADRREALAAVAAGGEGLTLERHTVVAAREAVPAPSAHRTYVAQLQGLGGYARSDADLLATVDKAQQYWVRESAGAITSWQTVAAMTRVTSSAASVAGGCGLGGDGDEFGAIVDDVAARAFAGVEFSPSSGNHLVVLVPPGCANAQAAGRARLGTSFASGGQSIVIEDEAAHMDAVMIHEYGHNLSFHHANNRHAEYGNLYEVMGTGTHFDAPVLGSAYRWINQSLTPGEMVDGSEGGTWQINGRSSAQGLRSVSFIDPDTGRRTFIDYRNGRLGDANTVYAKSPAYVFPYYNQSYRAGIVLEDVGHVDTGTGAWVNLLDDNSTVEPDAGALVAGQTWTNAGGSLSFTVDRLDGVTASVTIRRTPKPALPQGTVSVTGSAEPYYRVNAVPTIAEATRYRYQWSFNGEPIAGAEKAYFTPELSHAGGTLTVTVTGYAVGRDPGTASASMPVSGARWFVDGPLYFPAIAGEARVGATLTASLGLAWVNALGERPAGTSTAVEWLRDGKPIAGATGAAYAVQPGDAGSWLQVSESVSAPSHAPQSRRSDPVWIPAVKAVPPAPAGLSVLAAARPRIVGKPRVGKKLTARTPGWTSGTSFSYTWTANGKVLKRAMGRKLKVTRALRGKKIRVRVFGFKAGYKGAFRTSRAVRIRRR